MWRESSVLPISMRTVQGLVHVFGSSKVISRLRLFASTRVKRSVILYVSMLDPRKPCEKLVVSTTSVFPSQWPRESPR